MKPRDLIDFVLLAALWGASFLFMRIAVPEFGAFALMLVRCGVAALLMLGLVAVRGQLPALGTALKPAAWIGVIGSALPFALFGFALASLSAGLGSILNATTPMWTALVARYWLDEPLPARRLAGIVIGFIGVAALASTRLGSDQHSVLPILACLGATLAYGVAANQSRHFLQGVAPLVSATGSQVGATLALAPLAALSWPASPPSAGAWAAAIVLAVFCTALAYLLYFRLIRHTGAQQASAVTYLIPLFGVVWGATFLGERLEAIHLVGGLIIIIGSALVLGSPRRGARSARPAKPS